MHEQLPTYPDLNGKVAVVTGGSRALGAGTARQLARNGVRVAVNGRDQSAIDAVVGDIQRNGGQAIGVAADITDSTALERLRTETEAAFGPADILVAFAGGLGEPIPTEQVTEERWRATVDANLTGTFLTIQTFLPGMIERERGAIVTMASSAGRLPGLAAAPYAAAKAGILMLSRHLAQEMGKHHIRANCLAPSAVMNERMEQAMSEEQWQQVARQFPLGRIGVPDDVALATLFLVSDSASWLTGVTLDISGGRIIV